MKTSINVKYDIGNKSLVNNYYATNTHSEIIKGVVYGTRQAHPHRSHIAYGPYGSGKSYIATIIASLLSRSLSQDELKEISHKFSFVDDQIVDVFSGDNHGQIQYIPVILNGYEGDLSSALLNALERTLSKRRIRVQFPGIHNDIKQTIKRWKNNFPHMFNLFEKELDEHDLSLKSFSNLIEQKDANIVEKFQRIHNKLTAGSDFKTIKNLNVIDVIEDICKQLERKKKGIFFVYDEFGRVLQNIAPKDINQFMQVFQDLAELSNNGVKNLSSLFIAHRPISYYFSFESKNLRNEFAKVEKRFSVYEIKSDYLTFLQITLGHITKLNYPKPDSIAHLSYNTLKYNPFSGVLTDTEVEKMVVNQLHPLHPMTTFLLPRISSVFGQNERTLFSFLTDRSSFGLQGFIDRSLNIYYPDYLVNYFIDGIDESYVEHVKEYAIYKKNLPNLSINIHKDYVHIATRVYKFLLIWKISRGETAIKLTTEFISYALGESSDQIDKVLLMLSDKKMSRYNIIQAQWELFEGSSIDLEKEISRLRAGTPLTNDEFYIALNNSNPYKHVYPNEYNAEHEMTRFATIQIITKDTLNCFRPVEHTDYSYIIALRIPDSNILCDEIHHINKSTRKIRNTLHRLKVIDILKNDIGFINEHPNVEIELEYERTKINRELLSFYDSIVFLIHKNLKEFSSELSEKMSNKFPHTIHVVNDQVNMFQLTKIQFNALNVVLKKLLETYDSNLSDYFQGTKPADLIYFSIFENLSKLEKNKKPYEMLRLELNTYIEKHPTGALTDIIDIATSPPYGLRPHLAILIVFSTIITKWKDVMLFNNNNFIPTIEAEDLVNGILQRQDLRYVFSKFDNLHRDFLEGISTIFNSEGDNVKAKTLSVRVCSGMYNWYLSLPVITQQMDSSMNIRLQSFLKTIAKSRINPKEAIDDLMSRFQDLSLIERLKNEVENHFDSYKKKIVDNITRRMGIENLGEWAEKQQPIYKKNNKLVRSIIADVDLYSVYAEDIENIDVSRWTTSSFKAFESRLLADFRKTSDNNTYTVVTVNGIEKHVQDVDLSTKATVTLDNLRATLEATKPYYSDEELEIIVLKLVDQYIK
jgi:hypothetical protein